LQTNEDQLHTTKKLIPSLPVRFGVVSFLNDCSSEILTRTLPLFLATGLGVSPTILGLIEGIAETTTILVTALSGWLSDRMPARKPLVTLGYGLSAIGRTLMFFTSVIPLLAAARILDRVGKGFRTAPRDALIADDSHRHNVGRAFGIARSLDTIGAVSGLSIAILMGIGSAEMSTELFQKMLITSIPFAWIAVVVLILWVPNIPRQTLAKTYLAWHIPEEIRPLLWAIAVFALGSSSDAFLALRAQAIGFDFGSILSLFILYNIMASVVGWIAGQWSDKYGRRRFLMVGWLVYAGCYFLMAATTDRNIFAVGFVCFGAFYGLTEGVEKALLSDLLPIRKRGLGYGAFQTTLAVVAIPANLMTGWLAANFGLGLALFVSGIFSLAGAVILALIYGQLKPSNA
jgi:MFS family permease